MRLELTSDQRWGWTSNQLLMPNKPDDVTGLNPVCTIDQLGLARTVTTVLSLWLL